MATRGGAAGVHDRQRDAGQERQAEARADDVAASLDRIRNPKREIRPKVSLRKPFKAVPVARTGTLADIAHAVSFLASEGAGFTTGQVLYVAGGPCD